MTDPQQQPPAPQPPTADPYRPAAPAGAPGAPAYGGYPGSAPGQPGAAPYAGYGYPVGAPAAPGDQGAPAQRRSQSAAIATVALILAVAGFALEVLRYVGVSVAYAFSSTAEPLPQPWSTVTDVVLFLLYAAAVVLALIGLPRRVGRLRSGIALGLGVSGAAYLVLQYVFTAVG